MLRSAGRQLIAVDTRREDAATSYVGIDGEIASIGSLKRVIDRMLPYCLSDITVDRAAGKAVLVTAPRCIET